MNMQKIRITHFYTISDVFNIWISEKITDRAFDRIKKYYGAEGFCQVYMNGKFLGSFFKVGKKEFNTITWSTPNEK